MIRLFVPVMQISDALNALDTNNIDCDLDCGDRLMVSESDMDEADKVLTLNDIEFDIVA